MNKSKQSSKEQNQRIQVNELPPRQKQLQNTETQKVKGGGGVSGGVNGDRNDVGGGVGTGGGRHG